MIFHVVRSSGNPLQVAIFVIAAAVFVLITVAVETGGALVSMDEWISTRLHQRAAAPLTAAMKVVSFLGAPSTLTVVVALICVVLLRRRNYLRAVTVLTLVVGGNLLNYALKVALQRGRPIFEDPLLSLPTYSFPSGHAMAATVFYGFVVAGVLALPTNRGAVAAASVLMIVLVCSSRIYLGVHYPSDVLGGVSEAIAWSTLVLATASHFSRRLDHRRETPSE